MSTTTSLVLGSGGAKGYTHIGVIRCLEDHGYDIRYISGSSIGALIGGIYAVGKLDEYTQWVETLQRSDVIRLLDWSFSRGALFKSGRLLATLKHMIGEGNIEDLPIGYTAVATDINRDSVRHEIWLNRGSLFEAIRASIAVPSLFSPVDHNGRLLIDGGVINPVPVAPTLNDHTDVTIAVDLHGRYDAQSALSVSPARSESAPQGTYRQSIGRYVDRLWSDADSDKENPRRFYDIAVSAMELTQAMITQFRLAATPPAIVISMPSNICSFFDFHRAEELIQFGYERTTEALAHYSKPGVGPTSDTEVPPEA